MAESRESSWAAECVKDICYTEQFLDQWGSDFTGLKIRGLLQDIGVGGQGFQSIPEHEEEEEEEGDEEDTIEGS